MEIMFLKFKKDIFELEYASSFARVNFQTSSSNDNADKSITSSLNLGSNASLTLQFHVPCLTPIVLSCYPFPHSSLS